MGNILVVDDQLSMRNMFKAILKETLHKVDYSANGEDAYELAASAKRYDLIMADLIMPKMDGIELTTKLRAIARYEEIPIFIVSTSNNQDKKNKAKEVGANGWICKPVVKEKILELVTNIIG